MVAIQKAALPRRRRRRRTTNENDQPPLCSCLTVSAALVVVWGLSNLLGPNHKRQRSSSSSWLPPRPRPPSYLICNSAAEQFLFHAANIAALHLGVTDDSYLSNSSNNNATDGSTTTTTRQGQKKKKASKRPPTIRIPNVFLYNLGPEENANKQVRSTVHLGEANDAAVHEVILPTAENSVPLTQVIDAQAFIDQLQTQLGIDARLDVWAPDDKPPPPPTTTANEEEDDGDTDDELTNVVVRRHDASYYDTYFAQTAASQTCRGMHVLKQVSNVPGGAQLVLRILQLLPAGGAAQQWVDFVLGELPDHRRGVCAHYRRGPAWHAECRDAYQRLQARPQHHHHHAAAPIMDKSHCSLDSSSTYDVGQQSADNHQYAPLQMNLTGMPDAWVDSLQYRSAIAQDKFVYFVGEDDYRTANRASGATVLPPPPALVATLRDNDGGNVYSHAVPFWTLTRRLRPQQVILPVPPEPNETMAVMEAVMNGWDNAEFWAAVDFFVCRDLPAVVANSVSIAGSVQLALHRDFHYQSAFWYNSGSIPLAAVWQQHHGSVFDKLVPIVYTYDEHAAQANPTLPYHFMASILSVRRHHPDASIQVLYHSIGRGDARLLEWLEHAQGVTVHDHDPAWKDKLDEFRANQAIGDHDAASSSFAAWQRVDVPLHVNAEYCLFVETDTLLSQPLDLTRHLQNVRGVAAATQGDPVQLETDSAALDAGVLLWNVPFGRRYHRSFLKHALRTERFERPVHQSLQSYFQPRLSPLPSRLAFKPHWQVDEATPFAEQASLVHFLGPKPADYLQHLVHGTPCTSGDTASTEDVCSTALHEATSSSSSSGLCHSLSLLAQELSVAAPHPLLLDYCAEAFFPNDNNIVAEQEDFVDPAHRTDNGEEQFCVSLLQQLVPPPLPLAETATKPGRWLGRWRHRNNDTTTATPPPHPCNDFAAALQRALHAIPAAVSLPRAAMAQRLGLDPNTIGGGTQPLPPPVPLPPPLTPGAVVVVGTAPQQQQQQRQPPNPPPSQPKTTLLWPLWLPSPGTLLVAGLGFTLLSGAVLVRIFVGLQGTRGRVVARKRQRYCGGACTAKTLLASATCTWLLVCFVAFPALWLTSMQKSPPAILSGT